MKNILISLFYLFLTSFFSIGYTQVKFNPSKGFPVIKNSDTLDLAWAGGFNAPQFSKIDLNLDGKEDILVFDKADQQVMPFINVGDSNEIKYKYAPEYITKFPKSIGWMLMRDYNNDGKKDVFYCKSGGVLNMAANVSITDLKFDINDTNISSNQHPGGDIGIYIPSDDIPAIYDVNNDGDLDILTFGVLGTSLEYHKNYSVENYGHADSLDFVLKNYCWGHFLETGLLTNKLKLFDTCTYNVPVPEGDRGGGSRHVGSTVTAFDNNGDGVADLLLGDVTFNNIVMALNGGHRPDMNTSMISQDTAFPSYDTAVDLTLFPATFIEDVNNDGLNDLIVAPNTTEFSENYDNVWYYKNEGTNNIPIFRFQRKNLLHDEMIDLGNNSIPELFDYNADGLLDLVVSNYGYFNRDSITYECRLKLFKNIGSVSNPVYQHVTDDYQSISSLKLGNSLHPTFGDIDGDGDEDMILGNSEGYLHFFTNTAGAGNTASFSLTSSRLQSNLGDTIDVGQFSAPQLFDYDADGDLDLIVGKVNGSIRYYQNIGTTSSYSFKKITDTMGRVELHEIWDIYGSVTGFCTPKFYRNGTNVTLYCGTQQGGVYKFTGINTTNPRQTFIIDTVLRNKYMGLRSVPVLHDFKNDGVLDMILGNEKGGLNFLIEGSGYISIKENVLPSNFLLYPNPATESVTIKLENSVEQNQSLSIIDITGKLVSQIDVSNTSTRIDVSKLRKGVYFVTLISPKGQKTRKLVVQ